MPGVVGYHSGCGEPVHIQTHHGQRCGMDRFAAPDEATYECDTCGEVEPSEVCDTEEQALPEDEADPS